MERLALPTSRAPALFRLKDGLKRQPEQDRRRNLRAPALFRRKDGLKQEEKDLFGVHPGPLLSYSDGKTDWNLNREAEAGRTVQLLSYSGVKTA